MIGQKIESRGAFPLAALLFLIAALGLAAASVVLHLGPLLVVAVFPLAMAVSFWVSGREPHFAAVFGADTIEVEDPPAQVAYASLQNVWAGGVAHDPAEFAARSSPIHVQHEGGVLVIPARLDVPSYEVYRFLAGQVPAHGGRDVNPALAEYLARQVAYFGDDQVYTYRAAARKRRRGRHRRFRAFSAGLVLTGALWIVIGFSRVGDEGWGWGGIVCTVLGLVLYAVSFSDGLEMGQTIKHWKKSSLVISPQGMAMVQGDIQGEIRWPELLDVVYRPRPRKFALSQAGAINGILLRVKGAEIRIADIYDRPLYLIHDVINTSRKM